MSRVFNVRNSGACLSAPWAQPELRGGGLLPLPLLGGHSAHFLGAGGVGLGLARDPHEQAPTPRSCAGPGQPSPPPQPMSGTEPQPYHLQSRLRTQIGLGLVGVTPGQELARILLPSPAARPPHVLLTPHPHSVLGPELTPPRPVRLLGVGRPGGGGSLPHQGPGRGL